MQIEPRLPDLKTLNRDIAVYAIEPGRQYFLTVAALSYAFYFSFLFKKQLIAPSIDAQLIPSRMPAVTSLT